MSQIALHRLPPSLSCLFTAYQHRVSRISLPHKYHRRAQRSSRNQMGNRYQSSFIHSEYEASNFTIAYS